MEINILMSHTVYRKCIEGKTPQPRENQQMHYPKVEMMKKNLQKYSKIFELIWVSPRLLRSFRRASTSSSESMNTECFYEWRNHPHIVDSLQRSASTSRYCQTCRDEYKKKKRETCKQTTADGFYHSKVLHANAWMKVWEMRHARQKVSDDVLRPFSFVKCTKDSKKKQQIFEFTLNIIWAHGWMIMEGSVCVCWGLCLLFVDRNRSP